MYNTFSIYYRHLRVVKVPGIDMNRGTFISYFYGQVSRVTCMKFWRQIGNKYFPAGCYLTRRHEMTFSRKILNWRYFVVLPLINDILIKYISYLIRTDWSIFFTIMNVSNKISVKTIWFPRQYFGRYECSHIEDQTFRISMK